MCSCGGFGYTFHNQTGQWCSDPRFFTCKHGFRQYCCGENTIFPGYKLSRSNMGTTANGMGIYLLLVIKRKGPEPWFPTSPLPYCWIRYPSLDLAGCSSLIWNKQTLHWSKALELSYPQLRDLGTGIVSFSPALTAVCTSITVALAPEDTLVALLQSMSLNGAWLWFYTHPRKYDPSRDNFSACSVTVKSWE